MRKNLLYLLAASVFVLAGCTSTTTIYNPETENSGFRSTHTVSADELKDFAAQALEDAFSSNSHFQAFLDNYKKEMNDANARPILMLENAANNTGDSGLDLDPLTNKLKEKLLNSNMVDVTMAVGADLLVSIGGSRTLDDDANFDQSTVAKTGTLKAARLVMRPKASDVVTRDGSARDVVRTFTIDITDLKTGMVIWTFTRQYGFIKTRPAVGW